MMKNKTIRIAAALMLLQLLIMPASIFAQDAKTAEVYAAIRKEGTENSKIMRVMHYFSDVYGPRLTGSDNYVNAAKWGAREMQSWGFDNSTLEPWEFGHPGWAIVRNTGLMLKPQPDTLTFEVLAWTPGTKGPVAADAVNIVLPTFPAAENPQVMQNPTQEELTAYFERSRLR
ncbi:MAG: hypothetical protein IPG67_17340 [Acidobacteria bacterium]|nr:hypothetical protein [Acidobacteriota bacterium]